MRSRTPLLALALAATTPDGLAQGSPFQTPGMPSSSGQTTRFDNDFNPAIGLMLDFAADHRGGAGADGFDAALRSGELSLAAWVDPKAWAYALAVFTPDEVALEEGAVHYQGFEGNSTLRLGRFFVDFGKQMQAHEHALRTLERPAALRELLGTELAGDGVQWDSWTTLGDATVVRWSLGAFADLVGGHAHGAEGGAPEAEALERPDLDELALTGRLTGFTEVGQRGTLQLGASARHLGGFALHDEATDAEAQGLSNTVWGLDLTLGWTDATETEEWTVGGEFLMADGDLGGEVVDLGGGSFDLAVLDDTATGFYAFAEHAWDTRNSAGLQVSRVERPESGLPWLTEWDLHWTRRLTEFQRLRFGAVLADDDGEDSTSVYVQYTAFLGPHAHGISF